MATPAATLDAGMRYELHSDLAQFCLPTANRDENRRLAWVNSICLAFLIIGGIGLKPPQVIEKPLSKIEEIVPVVFTPPAEPPPPDPQDQAPTEEPEITQDMLADVPVVATVVAADATAVAFAVPVEGPVILAPAKYAEPPPPPDRPKPPPPRPAPVRFTPGAGDGGRYPKPSMPRYALVNRLFGVVSVDIVVAADGTPEKVSIRQTSGHNYLDNHALEHIQKYWRWPATGHIRLYYVEFEYRPS